MTPEHLARLHPRLYHVTRAEAVDPIRREGLLSAEAICDRLGIVGEERERVLATRRPRAVVLEGGGERFVVNDNRPIVLGSLARALDDGLRPADWLRILNRKVFLWTRHDHALRLAGALNNRAEGRVVLAFDTLSLARAHWGRMAASPINSGDTTRRPPRRGHHTFAALDGMDHARWRTARRDRGLKRGLDAFKEIVVDHAVPDAAAHLVDVGPTAKRGG